MEKREKKREIHEVHNARVTGKKKKGEIQRKKKSEQRYVQKKK